MWFNDTFDRDVGGLGRNILGRWEEWYSFRVLREISTLHVKRYDTGEWYNYRSQNWKNFVSFFSKVFVSGTNFPDENSQKKIRVSTPIKTFRLLIDVWIIVFTCYTFRRSIGVATLREREQEVGVKAKWFFELLSEAHSYKGCCNKGYSFYSRSFGFAYKW